MITYLIPKICAYVHKIKIYFNNLLIYHLSKVEENDHMFKWKVKSHKKM